MILTYFFKDTLQNGITEKKIHVLASKCKEIKTEPVRSTVFSSKL